MSLQFTDPDNLDLEERLLTLINGCLEGFYKGSIDTGKLILTQQNKSGKQSSASKAFFKLLNKVVSDKKLTKIAVTDDSGLIRVGSFMFETIDIGDMECMKTSKTQVGPNKWSSFIHELIEQYEKQVNKVTKYPEAHKIALKADAEVLGLTKSPIALTQKQDGKIFTVVEQYSYPNNVTKYVELTYKDNKLSGPPKEVPKPGKSQDKQRFQAALDILRQAIANNAIEDYPEVLLAAKLMEQTTGIPARTTESPHGRLYATMEALGEDIEAWSSWIEDNGDNIIFDPVSWVFDYDSTRLLVEDRRILNPEVIDEIRFKFREIDLLMNKLDVNKDFTTIVDSNDDSSAKQSSLLIES